MDIKKQIKYWRDSAEEDISTAEILANKDRFLHALFFCHLSIEKIVKAHVVKATNEIPPKSHNLFLLSEKAKLQVSEDDELFFGVLMKYQLEGRYPDFNPATPNKSVVVGYLLKTKALLKCLIEKL